MPSIEIILIAESIPSRGTGFKLLLAKVFESQTEDKSCRSNTASRGVRHFLNSLIRRSVTAIMCGAVLYKLGLDFVKSRIMTRSYGVAYNVDFKPGHHPSSRRIECLDGITRCENVMDWYVRKVLTRTP